MISVPTDAWRRRRLLPAPQATASWQNPTRASDGPFLPIQTHCRPTDRYDPLSYALSQSAMLLPGQHKPAACTLPQAGIIVPSLERLLKAKQPFWASIQFCRPVCIASLLLQSSTICWHHATAWQPISSISMMPAYPLNNSPNEVPVSAHVFLYQACSSYGMQPM